MAEVREIDVENGVIHRMEEQPEHGMDVLKGFSSMKAFGILCDVTLIAEGKRFVAHRVILASCSTYFQAMFTIGMRESSQKEIELKGITARGLEKILEFIYSSRMTLHDDDIIDVIVAANHLLVRWVIEFCERNFPSGMTTSNCHVFSKIATLYRMNEAVKQIDEFIAKNLKHIAKAGTLHLLTYDQMWRCLDSEKLCLREIDIFHITWEWLRQDTGMGEHAPALMRLIRFPLISLADLEHHVQSVDLMMSNTNLRQMVTNARNYHVFPKNLADLTYTSTCPRSYVTRLVSVGGGGEGGIS